MTINDFEDLIEFPKPLLGVVYILFLQNTESRNVPFYVGQTGRFLASRIAEYLFADFQSSTDFKVGEAVRYLTEEKNLRVLVGQKHSTDRFADEATLIRTLRTNGVQLLNSLTSYDYKIADVGVERARIREFCGKHLLNDSPAET